MTVDERYYRNLLDKLFDGIVCVDRYRVIRFWNRSAESLTGYEASELIGKKTCGDILVHMDEKGEPAGSDGCLMEDVMKQDTVRHAELYIRHKDGHGIPVTCKLEPLHDEQGRVNGAVQIFHDNTPRVAARSVIGKLRKLALIDPLTGLANRRYLERILDNKTDELRRYGLTFGLLFIDIDHFKRVNDSYGHETGDRVLSTLSQSMSTVIRSSDILGRWGGEEFLAIILNVERKELLLVAEKLRKECEKISIQDNGKQIGITVSIGATLATPAANGEAADRQSIVRRADELLYRSKTGGRNRVTMD